MTTETLQKLSLLTIEEMVDNNLLDTIPNFQLSEEQIKTISNRLIEKLYTKGFLTKYEL
jgi:hypothetical protein